MALSVGSRLGPYEIVALLGAGGMGEVYRARDTNLNRDVAIKVLLPSVANDPDRLARFRREAQVLASLNHPNIAHIHGVQESDGTRALVMELVEGPTLADRIAQGPISLDEALPIARQIAEALEAAHEQEIVHRDLKPANIKVRDDGTVKVLDFGLAKALEPAASGFQGNANVTGSPTITTPAMMTGIGVILGTAAYMSPEQAKGRPADKRSDIWSFGCVLYEMLTGTRTFGGDDVSDTLANVLKSEPDWSALPPATPGAARTLLRRCLTKDRKRRLDSAAGARLEIDDALVLPVPDAGLVSTRVPSVGWRRVAGGTLVAVVVGGAAAGTAVWLAMRPSAARVTRFALAPTGAAALNVDTVSRDLTITPDGTHIVYKGTGTKRQLWVRALDQLEPTPLAGGALGAPFTSPDGQWIGFVDIGSGVELKKVAVTGGPTLLLCRLDGQSRGASWGDDGSIIFATSATSTGLQRVSSAGSEPSVLTKPNRERGEGDHLWPQFLPGGHAVLFTITAATGGLDASQVAVLDLRTGTQKILVRGGSQAQYLPSGHLVYAAAGALRAVAFDLARLEAIGAPIPVLPQIVTLPTGTAEFDVARNGTLVYVAGGSVAAPVRTLVWVDRHGHEEAITGAPARAYVTPRLSPDGTRLALAILDQENDIWVWDFARQTLTRVTSDPGLDVAPVWMPDGRRMVFTSTAEGAVANLFWQAADGTGAAERLTQSSRVQLSTAVSPDGTRVVFTEGPGASDVMMLTLEKDRRVQPLVQTPATERNAEISPDGRWLAYETNDSGQFQIFVRPFPNVNTGLWPVSTAGGTQPLWAKNGQELFYLAPNGALMSVRVETGATWTASTPTKLIDGPYYRGGNTFSNGFFRTYDVSLDGTRFLMIKEDSEPSQPHAPPGIVVVQNWTEELKRLVPTK
jgi:eukaryotic-like serine/threonine-protein kinase